MYHTDLAQNIIAVGEDLDDFADLSDLYDLSDPLDLSDLSSDLSALPDA